MLSPLATRKCGRLAQLGEHLPYKQRVTGSSPVVPTTLGPVVQLVRMPACHAGGRGFEPHPDRHNWKSVLRFGAAQSFIYIQRYASVAQSVEQGTENPRVGGSIPPGGTRFLLLRSLMCGSGSVVERHLAKVNVASSNLVFRSNHKIKDASVCVFYLTLFYSYLRRHSQVVRQSSAKALFPSSNLGGASRNRQDSKGSCRFLFFAAITWRLCVIWRICIAKLNAAAETERINDIKDGIDNGTYSNRKAFDKWVKSIWSGEGSDTRDSSSSENGKTAVGDDKLPGKQSTSDTVGYSLGVSENSKIK